MRNFLSIASVATLIGCTSGPSATQYEQNASGANYMECLGEAIRRHDDGRTDPVAIARASMATCQNLHIHFVSAMSTGLSPAARERMAAATREETLDTVTKMVFTQRSKRR